MKVLILTREGGNKIRINPNKVIWYEQTMQGESRRVVTEIILSSRGSITVEENLIEIDKLFENI